LALLRLDLYSQALALIDEFAQILFDCVLFFLLVLAASMLVSGLGGFASLMQLGRIIELRLWPNRSSFQSAIEGETSNFLKLPVANGHYLVN
jgi:hypothetical protein